MANTKKIRPSAEPARAAWLGSALTVVTALAAGCGGGSGGGGGEPTTPPPKDPFQFTSMEAAANAPAAFTQPRGGVPLPDGSVALLATLEGQPDTQTTLVGERVAVLLQPPGGGMPTVLYAGDAVVNPFDIDASVDGKTLYVADPAAGAESGGAILELAVGGGIAPTELASGYRPRSVTVASDGSMFFSGIDPMSGDPGLFHLANGVTTAVFTGAPFVDPSGIALMKDGTVLVADTRLFDATGGSMSPIGSEAGIIRVKDGAASIFATGFATGYPAGIALSMDETHLIVSAEGADRSDTVYVFDVANPAADPLIVRDEFSRFQDSSAGLKRAHDSNTFIWASLSVNGGTVYKIRSN
jgi:DNA-binding beta-propeller fold protein YncE